MVCNSLNYVQPKLIYPIGAIFEYNKDRTTNFCLVCGLDQGEPPWGLDGMSPDYTICYCCGVEFGYEDCQLESAKNYRDIWLSEGAKWSEPKKMPPNWSFEEQFKNVPEAYK